MSSTNTGITHAIDLLEEHKNQSSGASKVQRLFKKGKRR